MEKGSVFYWRRSERNGPGARGGFGKGEIVIEDSLRGVSGQVFEGVVDDEVVRACAPWLGGGKEPGLFPVFDFGIDGQGGFV